MEENKSSASEKRVIIGLCVAILAMMISVILIFKALEIAMPDQWDAQVWDDMQAERGESFYDMRMIQGEEFEAQDIQKWLDFAQSGGEEDQVFWLYRQDSGEYVLYLPGQDRVLANEDLSATEEKMPDGRISLVVRARTPEAAEEIAPEEQLFCMKSESEAWDGQRVKVILDGREQEVVQSSSQGGKLYSEDGMEIE